MGIGFIKMSCVSPKFQRHGMFLSIVVLIAAGLIHCEDRDYAPPQSISNPLEFVSFGDGSMANASAQADIGRMLTNKKIDAIFLACSLDWNGVKYLPIPKDCSNGKVMSIENIGDTEVSLYAVYGRPGDFTKTFLQLPAPNRYFSWDTMSQRAPWLRKELTINLRVRTDSLSNETWTNSTLELRKSFIHRKINETLTESLQRGSFSSAWLPGSIYLGSTNIRENSESDGPSFPLFFGTVPRYEECDRSGFPLNQELRNQYLNTSVYNFTVCSSWRYLDKENPNIVRSLRAAAYIQWIILSVLLAMICMPMSLLEKCVFIFPKKPEPLVSEALASKRGKFPDSFSVLNVIKTTKAYSSDSCGLCAQLFICCSRFLLNNKHTCLQLFLTVVLPKMYFLFLLYLPYQWYDHNYLLDYSFTVAIAKSCWYPREHIHAFAASIVCVISNGFYIVILFVELYQPKKEHALGWQIVMSLAALICAPLNALLLVNLVPIVIFTMFGLVANYATYIFFLLPVTKIMIFDIFRVGNVNATISRKFAECNAAVGAAVRDLQKDAVRRLQAAASVNALTDNAIEKAQQVCQDLLARHHKVLLLVCTQFIPEKESGQGDARKEMEPSAVATSSDETLKQELDKEVVSSWKKHIGLSFLFSMVTFAILGTLQILFVHIGEITNFKLGFSLIIPAVTAISALLERLTGRRKETIVCPHQLSSAKIYFLMMDKLPTEEVTSE